MSWRHVTDLLKRWAELEPKRCRDDGERIEPMRAVGTPLERPWFGAQYHRIGQYEPQILAAVIEAIEARGWRWEMSGGPCPSFARVIAHDSFGCVADEPDDPVVNLLLHNYLAALEAEAKA